MQQSGPSSGNPTTYGRSLLVSSYHAWWQDYKRREYLMSFYEDRIIVAREPDPDPEPEPTPGPNPTPTPE